MTLTTGCGSNDETDEPVVSPACLEVVQAASDAPMEPSLIYQGLLTESLNTCATADAWLTAAKRYPGVAAVTDPEFVDASFLEIACDDEANAKTPVCMDGFETGVLDGRY